MWTVSAIVACVVCPCLPPAICSFDDPESDVFGGAFMDYIGHDEPPPTAAIVPPTPLAQASEVDESAPARRRIGRMTSEAFLPENVLGDETVRAIFASFLQKGVAATAGAQPHIEHEDSIVAEVNAYVDRISIHYNHWPYYMKRLAAAALATFQLRSVDVTEIEKVTIL